MGAGQSEEQFIFKNFGRVLRVSDFLTLEYFSKKSLHGGVHLIVSPLLFARKAGRTACLQTDN
jgi:hypothetical protein